MTGERLSRGARASLWTAAFVVAIAAWLGPRWWENRMYRQAETIAGVAAPVLPGKLADERKKTDPGRTSAELVAALGKPSRESSSDAESTSQIWTYYYADGTMTVNLSGGVVQRIALKFGPPLIPTSARP